METAQAMLGEVRTAADGSRRYMPVEMQFDSRALMLQPVDEAMAEPMRSQAEEARQRICEHLLHAFGVEQGNRKINDFAALGAAPWSVIGSHNPFIDDTRRAFTLGSYHSSLLGSAGLGERIFNDLLLDLRGEFAAHPATSKIANKDSTDNWDRVIAALLEWGVLTVPVAQRYKRLGAIRNQVVHYRPDLLSTMRALALEAIQILTEIVNHVFSPIGGPPRFIAGTSGRVFLSSDAESDPVVRKYFLPGCVLVSPRFEFRGQSLTSVWFQADYGVEHGGPDLSDDDFAAHFMAGGSPP